MIKMKWTLSISPSLFLATYCNGTWSSHANTTGRGHPIASNSNASANAKWKCAKLCRKRGKTLKRKREVKSSSGTQNTHANLVFLPAKESDKRPATTVGIQSAHTQRSSTSTASTASRLDNVILVKREDRQPVHSFKLRGAYAMMAGLTEEQKAHGVITASAGNHAQGVAFSSARLGVKSLIVMPKATADIKVDAVRGFGGEVLLHGANFDEAKAKAIELAQQQGFTWVPPFDHPMVIAGQGTLALELLQQDSHLDRVFVPVGGGGLAAGVAVLIKQLMPQIKVIAVEAEDSACLKAALEAGHPVDLPRVGLFAEGVAVKRIGDETFRLCQEYLDDIVTVDSDAICAAMKDLFEDVRAVAEPSGALALAGMKKYIAQHNIRGERLAHVVSGANVNFHGLS